MDKVDMQVAIHSSQLAMNTYEYHMKNIGMNYTQFEAVTDEMKKVVESFSTISDIWVVMKENSLVFDTYWNQYRQIHNIFLKYQQLILRDIETLNAIYQNIKDMEQDIQNAWK